MTLFALIYFFLSFPLAAWNPSIPLDIRENAEIRELKREIITAPTSEVLMAAREVHSQKGQEHRVAFEVRRGEDAYYLLFINEEGLLFPLASRGSWIIKRDLKTGAFVQAKIFYHSDPESFARLFPDPKDPAAGRSLLDVFLHGRRIHHNVPVGRNFADLLSGRFLEIVNLTKRTVDWSGLLREVDAASYENSRAMVAAVRSRLSGLPDAEDGAMDENGRLVLIDTLAAGENLPGFNCSGFAKWVADGLYKPRTGSYLSIEELKKKPAAVRGNFISRRYEDERDPFFGLDWSRNIAAALARLDGTEGVSEESQDVRGLPYWKYREDIGYPVEDLPAILYYLALVEPGEFYIASINREFGRDPVLRQHIHVALLFPVFEADGKFSVPVLERNVETGLESLAGRYPGDFVHLVRVKAGRIFEPPVFR